MLNLDESMISDQVVNIVLLICVFGGHVLFPDSIFSSWYNISHKMHSTVQRLYSWSRINLKHQFRIYFALLVYIYHTIQHHKRQFFLQYRFHLSKYQDGP